MEPGQPLSANLRLRRLLGQGGMGSVWVADHEGLGTQVAVKVMSRAVAGDPELVERFRREATAAAQLKSPHVAQVFDHGLAPDGTPFIVMELLDGEDLAKRVDREGPLPLAVVGEVIAQVAKALNRAHQAGIVHRDIKAENIFLTDHDGELLVKVLDFGIAKIDTGTGVSVTSTQGTFGTPLYMSPEQLLSAKNVDSRADLWSLAVVAYYMLTKRFPYSGETVGAISVAVHKGVFQPPSEVRPGLSAAVDALFRRAFEHEPAKRFASAKEMAEALRAGLATSSSTAPAITGPGPLLDPEGIGHLPTMDSRAGQKGGGPGGRDAGRGFDPERRGAAEAHGGAGGGGHRGRGDRGARRAARALARGGRADERSGERGAERGGHEAPVSSVVVAPSTAEVVPSAGAGEVAPVASVTATASAQPATSASGAARAPQPAGGSTGAAAVVAPGAGKPTATSGGAKVAPPRRRRRTPSVSERVEQARI